MTPAETKRLAEALDRETDRKWFIDGGLVSARDTPDSVYRKDDEYGYLNGKYLGRFVGRGWTDRLAKAVAAHLIRPSDGPK